MLVHTAVIAQFFLLLSTSAFAEPADEKPICTRLAEAAKDDCRMPAKGDETPDEHALAGHTAIDHRVLSDGVVFYDNQATFDAETFGLNLVCEDFSDSPLVGRFIFSPCYVTTISSTTTPTVCLRSVKEGFSISSSIPSQQLIMISSDISIFGMTSTSNAVGISPWTSNPDITFTTPIPTNVVSMNLYVGGVVTGSPNYTLQLFDSDGNMFASSQTLSRGFVGVYSETSIAKIRIVSAETTLIANLCFAEFLRNIQCGPSNLPPRHGTCGAALKCCDPTIGLVGSDCCGSVPFDPVVSSCCGDGTIAAGSDANCAPSEAPSSNPSTQPSSTPSVPPSSQPSMSNFPSSEPTRLTCDLGPVCDYDFTSDGGGGIEVEETYFAVCEWHDNHYHQGCYPESLVNAVGPGQIIPGTDDRTIITCGCCPEDGTKINGGTPVCDGALDCFAPDAVFSGASKKSAKKVKFETCIDGNVFMEENFYEPDDGEIVSCGDCTDNEVIFD